MPLRRPDGVVLDEATETAVRAFCLALRASLRGAKVVPDGADAPLESVPTSVTFDDADTRRALAAWDADDALHARYGDTYDGLLASDTIHEED